MDLEVIGRHALLFDDDATAAFVNSGDALVEWHSLQIDRYDVRHLLSSPPPPRRRNRSSEPIVLSDDSSLASQLDHERYLDLPSQQPDQPQDVEEEGREADTLGYRAVAFSYGNTDDSADRKNADVGMESSGFLPRFPIPNDNSSIIGSGISHSERLLFSFGLALFTFFLQPPTEKLHQIIARTVLFVSQHGGQSEIVLRVKQGDNPTFGFLMPGHHLHAYFRYLVDHPELVHSESDGKSQDKQTKSRREHSESNGVDGALSLLGSVYGSGEEEEAVADDTVKPENGVSQDSIPTLNHSISHSSKKIEYQADAAKDESVSKKPVLSNKDKVLTVKKNSLITTTKNGTAKRMEEKSRLFSAAADKPNSSTMGMTSKIEPVILEPPPELKKLIDKLVEFVTKNGKQFEANLIEQDSRHGRFPFLLPSNQYHSYYLKVLQTAQESKLNFKGINSGNDDQLGRGIGKKSSALKEKDFSSSSSDMPLESDRKEKFKMVISKSKKETHEAESKEAHQECAIDAAAAAALLQAATRGIKNSNLQAISNTSSGAHVNRGEGAQVGSFAAPNTVAVEADSEAHLSKEQKLKAERLKRAKMFVALLKSGEVPITAGTSRGSSLEPTESGVSRSAGEVNPDCKERGASLAPADVSGLATGEKHEINYFGDDHSKRHSKRKYRSRAGGCEKVDGDEDDDEGDKKEHSGRHSKRTRRSRSRRHDEGDENDSALEMERKHHRRRHRTHSSSEENEDEGERNEEDMHRKQHISKHRSHYESEDESEDKYKEDKNHERTRKKHHRRRHRAHSSDERESSEGERDHKHYKSKHRSRLESEDERERKYKEDKNHKRARKKHRSHSRNRRSSEQYLEVEDEHDDYERDEKRSGRRRRSSHRSRDKQHRHRHGRSSRDTEYLEDENRVCMDNHDRDERNELEEGEISSRVSEESRGIASGDISVQTSVDVLSSQQRAQSQPTETTAEVPDDLRAKIRAMLMSTRL